MCEEESDDAEAVNKLLEINDSIHRTIERYKLIKQGDLTAASKIPKGTLGTSTGVSKNADNELSLIDFGGDEPAAATSATTNGAAASNTQSVEDDLLGLSMQDETYGQGGGIALGFGANTSKLLTSDGLLELNPFRCTRTITTLLLHAAKYSKSSLAKSFDSIPGSSTYKAQLRPLFNYLLT